MGADSVEFFERNHCRGYVVYFGKIRDFGFPANMKTVYVTSIYWKISVSLKQVDATLIIT